MRIMIKGGVWKNSEDELVKIATMKYGKNQWERMSSMFRKSAKQCKARWYEWLDPSIKKIEWSREEDEKLLHLAKLMPAQWRTIAPIVGRTPSQCLERYEKLLDAACPKDENYEPGNDPRKLRPGEIDPNPESKPARPDPVDMDEDEKEMLSEARARLANTRGKKAKRKSRERQLEEARRLASLQKRRELKAAGIDLCRQKKLKRRRGIQYIVEIPFEKRPPPGFYDTAADGDCPTQSVKFPTTIEELEGERRVDKEAQLRKQDISRNKIALRQDAPSAILQANKLDNPESVRKMRRLNLPAPQIPDIELEAIAKIGIASDLLGHEEGNAATGALLASYARTPRHDMTPGRALQRTPAVKQNAIMMEAENLLSLTLSQTPLLGGDNPMLHPSDFSGVIPKKEYIATPNPLSTPRGSTRDVYAVGMTPRGTPMRDELRINGDVDMHGSAKLRQSDSKKQLIFGLKNLPQPKNDYQIVIQQLAQEDEEPDDKIEEDMSDRIAREKAEEEARQKALLKKRSRVLQRELPRPPISSLDLIRNTLFTSSVVPSTLVEQAHELVSTELLSLLENDNIKYPLDEKATKGKMKCGKRAADEISVSAPTIDEFDEDELKEADTFIEDEVQYLRVAMGHVHESVDGYVESHKTCLNDIMYFPTRDGYGLASVANHGEELASLQYEFENVKKKMDDETKKAQRHEQKIKILTNGYQMRATKLRAQVEAILKQLDTAEMELECFQALKKQEMLSGTHRISNLWEELQKQRDLELTLQRRYGDLTTELEMVQHLVNAYRLEAERDYENAAKEVDRPDVGTRKVTEADAAGEDDENEN